jgi:hypothetical protein
VALKQPTCSGHVVPPKVSESCKATCDAHASANLSCTPATIAVKVVGAADPEAAARYKSALEANLPHIIKVAAGVAPKLVSVLLDSKATIDGAIGTGQSIIKSRPTASAHVMQCLVDPFKGSIDAVASIQANVQVSVDVKASASATAVASR